MRIQDSLHEQCNTHRHVTPVALFLTVRCDRHRQTTIVQACRNILRQLSIENLLPVAIACGLTQVLIQLDVAPKVVDLLR